MYAQGRLRSVDTLMPGRPRLAARRQDPPPMQHSWSERCEPITVASSQQPWCGD